MMFFGGEVQQVKPASIFENDVLRSYGRKMDIEVFKKCDLPKLVFLRLVSPNVGAFLFVAIGQEIQSRAVPHRLGIGSIIVSDILCGQVLQIEQPDVRIGAAAITFPSGEVDAYGNVGQRFAIRRNHPKFPVGHRQFHRQGAFAAGGGVDRHFVELVEAFLFAGAHAGEENRFAIRIPI